MVNIRNVSVSALANGLSLSWEHGDARYHVWLDAPDKPRQVVYKNPPRGVVYKEPGWFQTRRLALKSAVNLRMVTEALRIAREADLYAKATADAQEAERQRIATATAQQDAEDRSDLIRLLHKFVDQGTLAQDAARAVIDQLNTGR
jgi:hypothetical protein